MYTPFKPHICQYHDGRYGIRKSALFFWHYLDANELIAEDNSDPYWWSTPKSAIKWCSFPTLTEAQEALVTYRRKVYIAKHFSKKV